MNQSTFFQDPLLAK